MSDELDLEVGRYALRSFEYFELLPYPEIIEAYSYWSDGRVRGFRSTSYHNQLRTDWSDGTCEAVCTRTHPRHDAPAEHCTCGIYGSLSYADLIAQFRGYTKRIVAVIAAEGVTIIGNRGLRTQFARVVAYWVRPEEIAQRVAAHQFEDAKRYDVAFEMVEAYGLRLLPATSEERGHGGAPKWWTG
jgi:hypothetical protein